MVEKCFMFLLPSPLCFGLGIIKPQILNNFRIMGAKDSSSGKFRADKDKQFRKIIPSPTLFPQTPQKIITFKDCPAKKEGELSRKQATLGERDSKSLEPIY